MNKELCLQEMTYPTSSALLRRNFIKSPPSSWIPSQGMADDRCIRYNIAVKSMSETNK